MDYFFKTKEEFEAMIAADELIEYEKYVDNYYGTPKRYVEDMMAQGKDVFLEIDVRGAVNIKKKIPEAVLVFVAAPSIAELKRRLMGRGTESAEVIEKRLEQIKRELKSVPDYDYLLINDDIEDCMNNMNAIVSAQRQKIGSNKAFIDKLANEINGG